MQFGFFNHRFSCYSAAVRFPATKVCSAISASNSTQQASSCACDRRRRKQQGSQWKTWANVFDRPSLLWLFSRGNYILQTFWDRNSHRWDINPPALLFRGVCVFMQAHAEVQVCLALRHLMWRTGTCDSPIRFPKWVWRSTGKLSQGQRWVTGLKADHWGVWCSAGILCYCVIVTLRDVKVGAYFKCLHKESPLLSVLACTSHFVDNHAPIVKCIFTYTQCHMPDNMEANLAALAPSTFQSNAEVKQAKPRSGSDIESRALIEWKAKQREFLSCFKLCLI